MQIPNNAKTNGKVSKKDIRWSRTILNALVEGQCHSNLCKKWTIFWGDKPGTSCTHTISSMDVPVLVTDPTGVQKKTDSTGGQEETDSTGDQQKDNKNEEDINVFSSLDFVEKVPDRSERMVQGRKRKRTDKVETFDDFVRGYFTEKAERAAEERKAKENIELTLSLWNNRKLS